jgi:transposase
MVALIPMKRQVESLLRGSHYDQNVSLRVITAALRLQEDYISKKSKRKGEPVPPPKVQNTVCRLLGVSPKNYTNIVSQYLIDGSIYPSNAGCDGRGGNMDRKETRIPRTKNVTIAIREFVRTERKNRKRVTARQILDFLARKGILRIPVDQRTGVYEKTEFRAALRNVQRFVQSQGYRRGRRNNIAPDPSLIIKRHEYLQAFFDNEALPKEERLRNVYMDESYIHEHYNRSDDSLWDPSDNLDIQFGKSKHKGRRYCFAAAIQGPDPLVDNPGIASEMAGLVPGTVWAFCPQQKRSHQGDYYKVFNGENFLAWWKDQLLPNLHQHSLIHMDNAAYHKVYGSHVPKWGKLRKQECIDFLSSKGIEVEARCPAVVVKARTKEWILANEKFECVRLAEEQGHKVLFTPPYHSDLQPIELTWARIKGNIGRQYSVGTTLALVHERLLHEFKNLEESGHGAIQGMINKCVRIAKTFYDNMPEEELTEEALEDEEDDDYDDYEAGFDAGVPPENTLDEIVVEEELEDVIFAANKDVAMENEDIEDVVSV